MSPQSSSQQTFGLYTGKSPIKPQILVILIWLWAFFAVASPQQFSGYVHESIESGYFDCPKSSSFCEISAVSFSSGTNQLILATDWWGDSYENPFFSYDLKSRAFPSRALTQIPLPEDSPFIEKVEDISRSLDNKFTVATGSFSHLPGTYNGWRHISRLVYWTESPSRMSIPDLIHKGELITFDGSNDDRISEILRSSLQSSIQAHFPDAEYFKIEGLAFLPDNKIAFGIREVGTEYASAKFVSLILITSYSEYGDTLAISTDFQESYNFDTLTVQYDLPESLGVSSLEYDTQSNRLYMTTSFEEGKTYNDIGSFLWVIPYPGTSAQLLPKPVLGQNFEPLRFSHKVEGIAVHESGNLLLVSDDDKITGFIAHEVPESTRQKRRSSYRRSQKAKYDIIKIVTPY